MDSSHKIQLQGTIIQLLSVAELWAYGVLIATSLRP